MSIFKAYDIRGKYPCDLDEEIAYKIGRALVLFLEVDEVCVGKDVRESSPLLFDSLVRGITDEGANVIDIGLSSTPMFYFAMGHYGFKSGLIITASHNPGDYNGFKLCKQGAVPIFGEEIVKIGKIVEKNEFEKCEKKGGIIRKKVIEDYSRFIHGFVREVSKLKVVIDAGNGMAGLTVPAVFKNLNVELVPLYFELDGSFPNHEADPLKKKNLVDLQAKVREEKADLGIAFDGDADRMMLVDENGDTISADLVTALLAKEFLNESREERVLYDLRSSRIIEETIRECGGSAVKHRVGHAFIKNTMREKDVLFAGEISGHYYFKENFFCDNALLAAVKLMNLVCRERKKLSELILPFRKYHHSGEINFMASNKEEIMQKLKECYSSGEHEDIDGVFIGYPDWWFNVRASNTEPKLRLNLEADSAELREAKLNEIKMFIEQNSRAG